MNCMSCVNFFVTWDPKFPMGCKLYGIKSKTAPHDQVFQNTGQPCLVYQPKNSDNKRQHPS